jgi:hypothetical protein
MGNWIWALVALAFFAPTIATTVFDWLMASGFAG